MLVDKFQLRTWEIARLTDRQIHEVYFHPRERDGTIRSHLTIPDEPKAQETLESELVALEALIGLGVKKIGWARREG